MFLLGSSPNSDAVALLSSCRVLASLAAAAVESRAVPTKSEALFETIK
jgi:hypothetical protein